MWPLIQIKSKAVQEPQPPDHPRGLADLPPEILRLVASLLNNQSKYALIRVSNYFRNIVETMLYERIDASSPHNLSRIRGIFRTLANRPDLAQTVTTFSEYINPIIRGPPFPSLPYIICCCCIAIPLDWWSDRQEKRETARHLRNVAKAFSHAKNIRVLHIRNYYSPRPNPIFHSIAPAIAAMDLRELHVQSLFWPKQLVPFLRPHINLTCLELSSGAFHLEDITPSDIPKLTHLTSHLEDARWIVPGRPVDHLRLESTGRLTEQETVEAYKRVSLSTGTVKELTVPILRFLEETSLEIAGRCIAEYLPAVETLCLHGTSYDSCINPKQVLNYFRRTRLPALRRLEIREIHPLIADASETFPPLRSYSGRYCGSWKEFKEDWRLAFPDIDIVTDEP